MARSHEGWIATSLRDLRWCSDGLEIKYGSGQTATATFPKDCCDYEGMAWRERARGCQASRRARCSSRLRNAASVQSMQSRLPMHWNS